MPSAPRSYKTYATGDDVAGVLAIPAGEYVVGIAAFAAVGVATGTVQVAANTAVPVPDGGAVELAPPFDPSNNGDGTLLGAVNITFTDILGFVVEVVS